MQSIGAEPSSESSSVATTEGASALKQLVIILAVIVALAIIAGGVWFYLDSKKTHVGGNVFNIGMGGQLGPRVGAYSWRNPSLQTLFLYRGLLITDAYFENITGDIAESYEVSPDGLTYTFKIRESERWSDGTPLTAEDVLFSLKAVIITKDVNSNFPTAFYKIKGAEKFKEAFQTDRNAVLEGVKIDGNTVTITLDSPHQLMLHMIAQLAIYPKHGFAEDEDLVNMESSKFWENPITNGMYKVNGVIDNKYLSYIRNEYYAGQHPKIDEIRFIPNFRVQDMDYYPTNNISEMVNLSGLRDFRKHDVNLLFYRYFMFNIKGSDGKYNEAMDNETLRNAIAIAIDKRQIFYNIYFNSGEIIDSGLLHSNPVSSDFTYEYNPEKARQLIKDSGYDLNRPLRMAYYYRDELSAHFLNAVAQNLRDVGFTVDLFYGNSSFLYGSGEGDREYDLALKGLSAFNYLDWYNEYTSYNPYLSKVLGATEYDDLITVLINEPDKDKLNQALRDIQVLEQAQTRKLPLFTLGQAVYINESRITLPEDFIFGNTGFRYDFRFDEWEVKRK